MKVLLLSPLPPPVGGIASWTVNILDYYKCNKEVEIINQNTAIKYRNIVSLNFFFRLTSGVKNGCRVLYIFFKYLKKYKPNVVHINSSGSMGLGKDLLLSLLSKMSNTPVVIHFHFGRIPEVSELNNWEWRILKRVVSFCSAVIVLDDKSNKVLKSCGFSNIYTIPNPVSDFVESCMPENEALADIDVVRVIFVGHVTKNKGVFELVEACCILHNIDELVLIGPYEEGVKEQLLKIHSTLAGNTRINFKGVLSKDSVLAEMRKASMIVLPSYTEGFPNVIIEAMAMKCPIIATNVGAIASMLNSGSSKPAGIVIEPKNITHLVDAINLIVTDTSRAELFKQNAFTKVNEEYTLVKVCNQYEKVWNIAYQNREI